jgi:hypothetical protein
VYAALLKVLMLGDGALTVGRSWQSQGYGAKREAPSLAYTTSGTGRQTAVTLLVPGAARTRPLASNDGSASAEVTGVQFNDTIVRRGRASSLDVAGLATDAECAVSTRGIGGIDERVFLLGASYVEGAGLERQAIAPDALFSARLELGVWKAESDRSRPSVQV